MVTDSAGTDSGSRLPAVLIGVGLGGFFDGIVLHQILQWHHMASELYPPDSIQNLQLNTTLDGLFHAFTWVVTLVGVALLWRAMGRTEKRVPMRWLAGGLLFGWGLFNVVEGLINHQLLGLHHVRPGPDQVLYDVAFLAWGAAMMAAGGLLLRRRGGPPTEAPS